MLAAAVTAAISPALASETVTFPAAAWGDRMPGGETVTGHLHLPDGQGPFPAVVLLPHCGGVGSDNVRSVWPDFLTENGYAALAVDTFGPQGQSKCVGLNKSESRPLQSDFAYGALDYLAGRSDVAGDRVAVMGFSEGAFAINNYIAPYSNARHRSNEFKAAISHYGGCRNVHRHSPGDMPLLLVEPEHDSKLAPQCMSKAGKTAHIYLKVLENAYHAYDDPQKRQVRTDDAGNKMLYSYPATKEAQDYIKVFLAHFIGDRMGTPLERVITYKGAEGARSNLDDWIDTNKSDLCSKDADDFADMIDDKVDDLKSEGDFPDNFTVSKFKMKRLYKDTCG